VHLWHVMEVQELSHFLKRFLESIGVSSREVEF